MMSLLKCTISGLDASLFTWLLESGAVCGAESEVIHREERVFRLSHPTIAVVLVLLGVTIACLGTCCLSGGGGSFVVLVGGWWGWLRAHGDLHEGGEL